MAKKRKPNFSIYPNYGWTLFKPAEWNTRMQAACQQVKKLHKTLKFDALAFTGSSGAAGAFILGANLELPVIYVRKKDELSHGKSIEANSAFNPIGRYLIIDDFVGSGATVRHIVNSISDTAKKEAEDPPECVGVFLYDPGPPRHVVSIGTETVPVYSLKLSA